MGRRITQLAITWPSLYKRRKTKIRLSECRWNGVLNTNTCVRHGNSGDTLMRR